MSISVPHIIFYTAILVWLFPPIKNWKTEYFLFFLALAVADPLKLLIYKMASLSYQVTSITLMMLLIAFLLDSLRNRIYIITLSLALTITAVILKMPDSQINYFIIIIHFIVVLLISIKFIENVILTKSINLFLILLLTYEVITIFRRIALVFDPDLGVISFFIGGAFQILFGIAFCFLNINSKSFKLIKE